MEKLPSRKYYLTVQEWESLIDDFQQGGFHGGEKWFSSLSPLSLLDLSLSSLLKKDFPIPLKTSLLIFLDEFADQIFTSKDDDELLLSKLIETLKVVIQSPIDGVSINYALKEQMLVSVTSITMTIHSIRRSRVRVRVCKAQIEGLIAILLAIINRPNHGVDRQTRAVACECLRELEREYPCLLAEIVGHLWGICQNERTHASQSYLLLMLQVIQHIVDCKLNVASVFSTAVPLVPFNVPPWVASSDGAAEDEGEERGGVHFGVELSGSALKELKRVTAFLLEWPKVLTSCGMVEFMSMLMPLAVGLELQSSLLKVQFSGLIYSYNPLLWHVVLMLCRRFLDMFEDQEGEFCRRLVLISKEVQQPLVFRLLALHWLLGFIELVSEKDAGKRRLVVDMRSNFYPNVYDALALKSLKLDLLAFWSVVVDPAVSKDEFAVESMVKYFEDGFVCVSGFKWLPPWSTETAVAFRTFYKFMIGSSTHSNADSSGCEAVMESAIFRALQTMLVNLLLDFQKLVPVAVALIDRLLSCQQHCCLGEKLLQTVDEHLLSKVVMNYRLSSYFLLFDRIGKHDSVPPQRLLELLTKFTIFVVEKHGSDAELKSWHKGSKVLGICRTLLLHHPSSRLFMGLSRLLAFTTIYFPDLEVRDNARLYLRMLICVPGKKLRNMLNLGDQLVGITPSSHASSLYNVQSPRFSDDLKKSRGIASYVHLERAIPLLVKQSWSLSLPAIDYSFDKNVVDGIKNCESEMNGKGSDSIKTTGIAVPDNKRIEQPQEPLRVMDSKNSGIVDILRQHFSCIPDFRHMLGIKIRIFCSLRFKSEPFNRIWGSDSSRDDANDLNDLPAMYGIVLKFSSSAPYGSMPSYHIPFLLGESTSESRQKKESLDIVSVGSLSSEKSVSKSSVTIELEPQEPVPGLVDVSIDANADNGQVIQGKLQGVRVGIEDMFLKAIIPAEILEDEVPGYYANLFDALWEAFGASSDAARETFSLKGGKGFAAIHGTQSVKLLEVPSTFAIRVVEQHLAPFVVGVIGRPLVEVVKDGGLIKDAAWVDVSAEENESANSNGGPLYLTYVEHVDNKDRKLTISKTNTGCFLVLVFLPPRYHLLFRIEVSDVSTLVRIRTDHWPCLAYIDEYLEALFLS